MHTCVVHIITCAFNLPINTKNEKRKSEWRKGGVHRASQESDTHSHVTHIRRTAVGTTSDTQRCWQENVMWPALGDFQRSFRFCSAAVVVIRIHEYFIVYLSSVALLRIIEVNCRLNVLCGFTQSIDSHRNLWLTGCIFSVTCWIMVK